MLASIPAATVLGASGYPVTVEVHVGKGLPGYHIVGTPDTACRESRDRVRAAVISSGFDWPSTCITVNLAPSGHRKIGAGLDLAIAVGVLVADGQLPPESVDGLGFIGELGLDGSLRRVPGVAPMVAVLGDVVGGRTDRVVRRSPRRGVPRSATWPRPSPRWSPRWSARRHGRSTPVRTPAQPSPRRSTSPTCGDSRSPARRSRSRQPAVTISCWSGRRSGKTMLAQRLTGILPPLDREQALEATMVHSAAGVTMPHGGLVRVPPFRAPHHTSSTVRVGGRRLGHAPPWRDLHCPRKVHEMSHDLMQHLKAPPAVTGPTRCVGTPNTHTSDVGVGLESTWSRPNPRSASRVSPDWRAQHAHPTWDDTVCVPPRTTAEIVGAVVAR